jgi:SAM-dependent methyltransferase
MTTALLCDDGEVVELDTRRWFSSPSTGERRVLEMLPAPVLDIGCGPGRHVLALARQGRIALGVDAAPTAVAHARSRGAPVLLRSIFDRVPAAGRWGSALLFDGSIGIGGDPAALLARTRGLLRAGGSVLVELEAPGVGSRRVVARLRTEAGLGDPFPWARVGVDDIGGLSEEAGFHRRRTWTSEGRWFAWLDR